MLAGLDELQTRFSIPVAPATDVLDARTLTATVTVEPTSGDLPAFVATALALDPAHTCSGIPDSLSDYFTEESTCQAQARSIPIVIDRPDGDGLDVLADIRAAHDARWRPR